MGSAEDAAEGFQAVQPGGCGQPVDVAGDDAGVFREPIAFDGHAHESPGFEVRRDITRLVIDNSPGSFGKAAGGPAASFRWRSASAMLPIAVGITSIRPA